MDRPAGIGQKNGYRGWAICAMIAGLGMKLFSKIISKKDEKVLDEARDLARDRLKQYIADRQTATKEVLRPLIKTVTRLRWW
jgi:hypothetical protein